MLDMGADETNFTIGEFGPAAVTTTAIEQIIEARRQSQAPKT